MQELASALPLLFTPDEFIATLIGQIGAGIYVVLFLIVFAETGLVVTPFLPGDSLLFAGGAVAAAGGLGFWPLAMTLLLAAIAGDAVNYAIGRRFGGLILRQDRRWVKREHFDEATEFFQRHGGKAVFLARFAPFVRTFVPFVAGMCDMSLPRFWMFNITGAVVWVTLFTGAGYLFGNMPWVEENLTLAMLVIVGLSVSPMIVGAVRRKLRKSSQQPTGTAGVEE
jgi:membrane-associated protein